MDVEENRSDENDQVLAAFDGLLHMVYHFFFLIILCSYNFFYMSGVPKDIYCYRVNGFFFFRSR